MPAKVDEALQIAVTVFEAEAQEKENLAFFSNFRTHKKSRGKHGQPWKIFEDQSTDRLLVLAPTRRMQAGSSVSKTQARITLAANKKCFVLCGKLRYFARECISNKFSNRKNEEKNG
jgi:hypothetical protein